MNGLISWWAKNSVAANLLMILILIAGIAQFFQIDREEFPSPSFNYVRISVSWPGAGPRDVEEQIVVRIEEALSNIDGVKSINSSASESFASLTIEMADDGRKFDTFLNEVKAQVDAVSNLPQDSFPPVVRQLAFAQNLSFITFSSSLPEREHNRLAREIRDEIAGLDHGTPLVDIYGERVEEVSIEVSEETLQRYGLTFNEIANAIRASSINQSAGSVKTSTGNIPLAIRNLADDKEEFDRIIIRQNRDGSVIKLSDIATVKDGFTETRFKVESNDLPAITISPKAPEKLNIVKIADAVAEYIVEKQKSLPPEATLILAYDSVESYRSQLSLVNRNAGIGLMLVLFVLALFLRPVVAFWVAAGIAISFVGTFIFMPMAGVSLNFLSLFGLLLVIGIVVDDALIVGESIHRQTERGKTGIDAAIIGTQLVAKPVLFAVLTTMIAFAPFIFIGGGTSQFTKHIAWTIILALLFSLIESFFILPAHLAHMKKPDRNNWFTRFQSIFADGLNWVASNFYRPIIKLSLAMRWTTVIVFIGLFMFSTALLSQGWVKFNFMPSVEGRYFEVEINPQEGTPYERNLQIFDRLNDAIDLTNKQFKDELGFEMLVSKRVYVFESTIGAGLICIDGNERTITLSQFADRLRENIGDIPDAEDIILDTDSSGDDDANQFVVSLEGKSLDDLSAAADDLKEYLRTVPGMSDVRDSFQTPNDELRFKLIPGAERFGLSLLDISRQVRQAYFGEEVQRLPRNGRDVRVMLRYPLETRESLDSLDSFRVRTPDGREVPLAAVAEVDFAPSLNRIRRIDRQLAINVRANLTAASDQGALVKAMNEDFIPEWKDRHPGVGLKQRGEAQGQAEFFTQLLTLYMIALFCMYMLLAIAFGSYFQPIMIMSAIPFGFMGALYGHALLGVPFAMFSVFGIAAAGGVVVNDNLVLIDYVNRLRKEGAGAFSALVEAGVVRFRPIVLTSITTFIGLVPILNESSVNAQFLKPMIVSLAFGVLFALFVTLIFVPALYGVGVDIARFYRGLWTGKKQPRLGDGQSKNNNIPDIDPDSPSFDGEPNEDGEPELDNRGGHMPAE